MTWGSCSRAVISASRRKRVANPSSPLWATERRLSATVRSLRRSVARCTSPMDLARIRRAEAFARHVPPQSPSVPRTPVTSGTPAWKRESFGLRSLGEGAEDEVPQPPQPGLVAVRRRRHVDGEGEGRGTTRRWASTHTEMALVPPPDLVDFVARHAHPEAEAYLLSCTALRSAPTIEVLEQLTGRGQPGRRWHAMSRAEVGDVVPRFGRLLTS